MVQEQDEMLKLLHAELEYYKKQRGAGRPANGSALTQKIQSVEAQIKALEEGRFPSATAPPPPPAATVLAQGILDDKDHHRPGVAAPRGRPTARKVQEQDGREEADDELDDDDGPPGPAESDDDPVVDKELRSSLKKVERVSKGQQAFISKVTKEFIASKKAKSVQGKPFTFFPDVPTVGTLDVDRFGLGPVHVWSPSHSFGTERLPCPKCGFDKYKGKDAAKKSTKFGGFAAARRVVGVDRDEFLVGAVVICKTCRDHPDRIALAEKAAASQAADVEAKLKEPSDATKALNKQLDEWPYTFRSYDPAVMKMYFEKYAACLLCLVSRANNVLTLACCRYPWIAVQLPAHILTQRIAVTPELGTLLRRFSCTGSNPTDLAKALSECKGREFDRQRIAFYGYAAALARCDTRDHLDIGTAFAAGKVPVVTEETWGVVYPGHALVRSFVRLTNKASENYQFAWREQHCWGEIVCADHTLKLLKGQRVDGVKVLWFRFTLWSNDLNCPLLVVNTATSSYDDPALVEAFKVFDESQRKHGHPEVAMAFLDNVRRDQLGFERRVPSLRKGVDAEVLPEAAADKPAVDEREQAEGNGDEDDDARQHEPNAKDIAAAAAADESGPPEIPEDAPAGVDELNVRDCLLQSCVLLVTKFAESRRAASRSETIELRLPSVLRPEDREKLHAHAEDLGLRHESVTQGEVRCLIISRPPATSTSAADSVRPSECEPSTAEFNNDWGHIRTKADVVHWMRNVFKIAHSKGSGLYKYWCTALADAVFQECDGERERVLKHAKALGVKKDDMKKLPRKFFRLRARYLIPEPRVLYQRLQGVYKMFAPLWDPVTNRPFLVAGHKNKWATEMWYVRKGYVSDPPADAGVPPLYVKARTCAKTGFEFYECKRGSTRLEGSFLHTAFVRKAVAMNASPEWLDCIVNEHDFRVCVKALRKRELLPPGQHFDLQLLDILYDLIPPNQRSDVLGNWKRTIFDPADPPRLRHGLHFGRESLRAAAAAAKVPEADSAMPAASANNCKCPMSGCVCGKSLVPTGRETVDNEHLLGASGVRVRASWEDIVTIMEQVIASGAIEATDITKIALSRGLMLMVDEAQRFVDKKLQDERVWAVLKARRHRELQSWLRRDRPSVRPAGTFGVASVACGSGAGGSGVAAGEGPEVPSALALPRELMGAAVGVGGVIDASVALHLTPAGASATPVVNSEASSAHEDESRRARRAAEQQDRRKRLKAAADGGAEASDAARAAAAAKLQMQREQSAARMRKLRRKRG